MQECSVCGLLFLGGGACPSCGSQVATDVDIEDVVMDDDNIPGLDEIVEAIGDTTSSDDSVDALPFGMGAKAGVVKSSLPFGVGSFTSEEAEPSIPIPATKSEMENSSEIEDEDEKSDNVITVVEQTPPVEPEPTTTVVEQTPSVEPELPKTVVEKTLPVEPESPNDVVKELPSIENEIEVEIEQFFEEPAKIYPNPEIIIPDVNVDNTVESVQINEVVNDVPDMWRIDAAEVDMEAIYAQEDEIVEITFEEGVDDDIHVTFDDFHHSPVEESMASDEDAPELHPAKALPVDSAGQPEIATLVESAFECMSNSSWMQAAQILSTASHNRQNDPAILNNLGLALLQSALEMDSLNDPMSDSQYEAAIMALRQGAKIDSENNTILLNLSHALLVSGRAEKALGVIDFIRSRVSGNVEIENAMGACLIQLGRDEEAEAILRPYIHDAIVSTNLDLI